MYHFLLYIFDGGEWKKREGSERFLVKLSLVHDPFTWNGGELRNYHVTLLKPCLNLSYFLSLHSLLIPFPSKFLNLGPVRKST
jgi:hypothetical protein